MPESLPPPDECANCGASIPRHARACPECGADERTGWRDNEHTRYDGLDLPEEAWTGDGKKAAGERPPNRVNGVPWYWWCVGIVLIVLLAMGAMRFW